MWTASAAQSITSSMFLTANAANLVAISLLKETTGVTVSWTEWLLGFLPWLVFVVYPPSINTSEAVTQWAMQEQTKIGTIIGTELLMATIAILVLVLWGYSQANGRVRPPLP